MSDDSDKSVYEKELFRRYITLWKAHKSFPFIYTHCILKFKDDFFSRFSTVKFSEHPIDRVTTKNETSRDTVTYTHILLFFFN